MNTALASSREGAVILMQLAVRIGKEAIKDATE